MIDIAIAVLAGCLIGISLGFVGAGGSILSVPLLIYGLGQSPHAATTESLVVVGLSATTGSITHWRAGNVNTPIAGWIILGGIPGILAGTTLNHLVNERLLLTLFSIVMTTAAAAIARRARTARRIQTTSAPGDEVGQRRHWSLLLLTGSVLGLTTGFFGVGGGFVIVPALVAVAALAMRNAVATSLMVIAANSAGALLARIATSAHVDASTTIAFGAGAIAAAALAGRFSGRISNTALSYAFATITIALAVFMFAQNAPHIHA